MLRKTTYPQLVDSQGSSVNITASFQTPNRHETLYHPQPGVWLQPGLNLLPLLMKLTTTLVVMLLGLSLLANSAENSSHAKGRDSKPDHKEPGKPHKGEPDQKPDRDNEHRHGPKDRDGDRPDHSKSKPPKPPKPPKDHAKTPAAPTQLVADAVSEFQVNLMWVDNSTNELGFKIERSLDGINYAQIAQVLPNTTVYRDLNRFPDTKYFYRARAFNAKGNSAYSAIARTRTPAPKCELSVISWGYGTPLPTNVNDVVAVAAGGNFSTALKRDGSVVSWQNDWASTIVTASAGLSNIVAVASGAAHSLALRADGSIVGWGENSSGLLNLPSTLSPVVAIAAGSYHNLALRSDGTVVGWGKNDFDQTLIPNGLSGVVAIAAGGQHSLALRSDGTVVSWGAPVSHPPSHPAYLTNVVAIAAGDYNGLALHADGRITSWTYAGQPALPPAPDHAGVMGIAAGSIWNFAWLTDGTLASWGYDTLFGQPPSNLTGVVALSTFGAQFLALTTTPAPPPDLTATVLATNRVVLKWRGVSVPAESIAIQRTTNYHWTFPGLPEPETIWTTLATVTGNVTHYEDPTTLTNQTYSYRLQARNSCGTSLNSTIASASVTEPVTPPWLSAQAFADNAILSFAPANAGSVSLTIERALDPEGAFEPWLIVATVPAANQMLAHTNTGLALNTTYWYRARESNGLGESPYSPVVPVTITAPVAPTGLLARIGETNQIDLSWYIPWPAPEDQAGFKIERAVDFDGVAMGWTEVGRVTSQNQFSYSDTVPGSGGTFWYRVRAFNVLGDSPFSDAINVTLTPPTQPQLFGQNYGLTVRLEWQDNYPGTTTYFRLERTLGANGVPESWQEIARGTNHFNADANYGRYDDPGLLAGETYRYRVRTFNWLGESDFSSPISVTIEPPTVPDLTTLGVGGSNYVTLGWGVASAGIPVGIRIERAPDNNLTPGPWMEIANLTNAAPSLAYPAIYHDSNVSAGGTYWYRLRAYDAAGISDYSEPQRVWVQPPPSPGFLSAYSFADQAHLSWFYGPSANQAGGFRIERAPDHNGGPGTWSYLATLDSVAGVLPDYYYNYFTDTVPSAGTYWYRIAAFNWVGASEYSPPLSVTLQPPALSNPLTVRMGNTQQVGLSWQQPLLSDHDGVEIEHAPDVNGQAGTWEFLARHYVTNQSAFPGFYASQFIVTNVPANTTNWYRVRAFNALGYSDYIGPEVARTVAPPPAPENLTAQSLGTFVRVQWLSNNDYGFVTGFAVERATDSGGGPGVWTRVATVNGGDPSYYFYDDYELTTAARYWYRVRAFNWLGESPRSEAVSMLIVRPPPPIIETPLVGLSNQVTLRIAAAQSVYFQHGFKIERAPDASSIPGAWTDLGSVFTTTSTPITFTDTNVTALSTNWYRARVISAVGISEPSTARRIAVVPPATPHFEAEAVANRITLSLHQYIYFHYGSVAGFRIERAPDFNGAPGTWSRIATTSFVSAYTDTSLPAGPNTYWYRIQAYNWIGESDYSPIRQVNLQPPLPPYDVRATVSATNRVKLTWTAGFPSDQDGFKVERAPDVNHQPGSWTTLGSFLGGGSYGHGFVDTNITANTTNWYRVTAFNVVGDSLPSVSVSVRLSPPAAPDLYASTFADRVNLFWTTDYGNYGLVQKFELERAGDESGSPGNWEKIATLAGDVGSHVDAGRPTDARHWYRVRAQNWLGFSPYSEPVSATIVSPAAPLSLSVQIGGTNQIIVGVQASYPYEQDGFEFDRAVEVNGLPGEWEFLARVRAANQWELHFTDSNALAQTTNWYRARTFNVAGISTNSEPLRIAVVPPPAPSSFTVVAFANQARLSWSRSFPNYGQVQGFNVEQAPDVNGSPGNWTTRTNLPLNPPGGLPPFFPGQSDFYSFTDLDLTPNETYWYRVQAYNWVGDGEFTAPASVTIVPPGPPRFLTAKIGVTNTVDLEWYAPNANDQAGYLVERAFDFNGTPQAWMEIAAITNQGGTIFSPSLTNPRYSDPNVNAAANSKLWYRVRSFNAAGLSDYTTATSIAIIPPPAPNSLRASVFKARATIHWNAGDHYGYGVVAGFKLERADETDSGPGTWSEIATTTSWNYTDDSLSGGATYWYRVKAYNWLGAGVSTAPISVTIQPPPTPRYLTATVGTTNQVALRWQSAPPYDQDGFELERAADGGGAPGDWEQLASISATNEYSAQYLQTNAVANSTNWYRVRAFNQAGLSGYTEPLQFIVSPPPAPVLLAPSQFADRVNLAWNVYTAGEVGGFKVERAVGLGGNPGTWTEIAHVSATNSFSGWWYAAYADAGRTVDTTYWYRVRSYNWVGDSDYSAATILTVSGPRVPSNLSAGIGLTNQVDIWWFGGGLDIDGYYLERAADAGGAPAGWNQIATIPKSNGFPEFTDTNLTWYTTNWYRVRAFNSLGVSAYSPSLSIGIVPPPAPTFTWFSKFANRLQLAWQFPVGTYGIVFGYKLERALDAGGIPGAWAEIQDLPSFNYPWSDQSTWVSNLTANTTYWYRLRAYNWLGDGAYSSALAITVTPPRAPSNLTASISDTNVIHLRWSAHYPPDQEGFKLERSTDAQMTWSLIGLLAATNQISGSYSDTNPVVNVTNYYRVRAFNFIGDSPYSPIVSTIIELPTAPVVAPAGPEILALTATNHDVLLTWSATSGTTNVVEATDDLRGAFAPISPNLILGGDGSGTTNFLDAGALTNSATRFYRIRLVR